MEDDHFGQVRKEQSMGKIKLGLSLEELAKAIMELPPKEREELW